MFVIGCMVERFVWVIGYVFIVGGGWIGMCVDWGCMGVIWDKEGYDGGY